jgi:hypothetical protein
VSAWLGWLLALPGVIWRKAANIDPAWVQAFGSILAILAGFGYVLLQSRHTDRAQEADRVKRAEVVAYRLSGWIVEIGIRIERALRTCQEQRNEASRGHTWFRADLILEIRLGMEVGIDGLLSDLHYLDAGSGDIAQLDYFAAFYDGWLDRLYVEEIRPGEVRGRRRMTEAGLVEFLDYAEKQLTNLKTLHTRAQQCISALVPQAIKKGR